MKRTFIFFISLFIFWQCTSNQAQQNSEVIENVDAKKFKELIETSGGILLDVRTPGEVNAGYINGASTIDFYDEDFEQKLDLIKRDNTIFIYCKSGGRSSQAARVLHEKGFKKVYNLSGGIMAWENSGYSIVIPESSKDDKIRQMSLEDFSALLKTDKPVLVDFHTKWCVPCKKMAPVIDKISELQKDKAIVLRIDVDKSKEVAKHYQVHGIPVFMIFKNGEEKWKHSGIIVEEKILSELSKYY